MKNLDLSSMGVREMNTLEMQETDGGLLLIICLIAGVALLAGGCINNTTFVQIGSTNSGTNAGGGPVSADSSKIEIPIDVPIGYK